MSATSKRGFSNWRRCVCAATSGMALCDAFQRARLRAYRTYGRGAGRTRVVIQHDASAKPACLPSDLHLILFPCRDAVVRLLHDIYFPAKMPSFGCCTIFTSPPRCLSFGSHTILPSLPNSLARYVTKLSILSMSICRY